MSKMVERDGLIVIEAGANEFYIATPTDGNVFGFGLSATQVDYVLDYRRKYAATPMKEGDEPAFVDLLRQFFRAMGRNDASAWRQWANANLAFTH